MVASTVAQFSFHPWTEVAGFLFVWLDDSARRKNCGHFVTMFAVKRRREPGRQLYLTAVIDTNWH